ncbi:uncharacterized protein LOC130427530 [Triplophysa dalaica]|uniref:uncharacterized protein LOC130427530 n=1 Tax=Triplophysa dalaica TaxID=1582913 RepID=UPI0024DF7C9E|nr:uncharacterized protein LOC130427530 [Triplophysa dalaica]
MIEHLRISSFQTKNIFTSKVIVLAPAVIMLAISKNKRRKTPLQDAKHHISSKTDKPGLQEKFINQYKGRGVFTTEAFFRGDFVLEYRSELLSSKDSLARSEQCSEVENTFLFDFQWRGKHWCMDASKEDGSLGRLVNDEHKYPNCTIKTVEVNQQPHLCLFAVRDIEPGEEINYSYGDSDWPWRAKARESSVSGLGPQKEELGDKTLGTADDCSFHPSTSENQCVNPSSDKEKELGDKTLGTADDCSFHPSTSENQCVNPSSDKEKELGDKTLGTADDCSFHPSTSENQCVNPSSDKEKELGDKTLGTADDCSFHPSTSENQCVNPSSDKEKELGDKTLGTADDCSFHPSTSENQCVNPSSDKEKELGGKTLGTADDCSFHPSTSENQSVNPSSDKEKCPHEVHCSVISCLDSCEDCSGPVSSRRWLGLTCTLCSRSWHKTCFLKKGEMLNDELSCSEDISSDEEYTPLSSDDFIPDSRQNSDSAESPPYFNSTPAVVKSSKIAKNVPKPTYLL